jgi:hypothetical protein
VTATDAPCRASTTAPAGRPIANRATVTSRLAMCPLTIRPSTVPTAHSTAAPTASSAATSARGATDSGSAKAISHAPASAGTAYSQYPRPTRSPISTAAATTAITGWCPESEVRGRYRWIQPLAGKAPVRASYRAYSAGPATPPAGGWAAETSGVLPTRDTKASAASA